MSISLDEYMMETSIFLAEQDFFSEMIYYGGAVVNESAGLISISEGVKETIMKYIDRVTDAIQKAWDRFKELCTRGADSVYLKLIAKKMEDPKPDFSKDNYLIVDFTKLDAIQVQPFDYEAMKDVLDSKESFIQKYYPGISGKGSLKENIEATCVKKETKQIDAETLKAAYKFLTKDFPPKMANIENDLKKVNTSNKNIARMVSTITPAETTNEATMLLESMMDIYHEEGEFYDGENGPNNSETKKASTSLTSHVTNYVYASTDVITAKMKIYKDIYNDRMKIIKHYIKPEKEEKKDEKSGEANVGGENVKQVNT